MSRTSILAILAGAGISFSGLVTTDAVAFARAIQTQSDVQLTRFANQYPDSSYRDDALRLADASCQGNWVNAGCTTPPVDFDNQGRSDFVPAPPPVTYKD